MKLRKKLSFYVYAQSFFLIIFVLTALGGVSLFILNQQYNKNMGDTSSAILDSMNQHVGQYIRLAIEDLKSIHNGMEYEKINKDEYLGYLNGILNFNQYYNSLYILDRDKKIIALAPNNQENMNRTINDSLFGHSVVSDDYVTQNHTVITMFEGYKKILITVKYGSLFITGELNIDALLNYLKTNYEPFANEYYSLSIVDSNGYYINIDDAADGFKFKEGFPGFDQLKSNDNFRTETNRIFTQIKTSGFYLVLTIDKALLFKNKEALYLALGVIFLLAECISIILAYRKIKMYLQPVNLLVESTKYISNGDYDSPFMYKGFYEMENLVDNFNQMKWMIREREEKLNKLTENLEHLIDVRTKKLKKTNEMLKKAKEKADLENKQKSFFLATMSHEIRTPLNALTGFLHLLKCSPLTSQQNAYLSKATLSAENLLDVINDILDFAKIEANKIEVEHLPFSLKQILHHIENMVKPAADSKRIYLVTKYDDKIPETLIGDYVKIKQILLNIVNNGVKFTDAGGVKIEAVLKQKTSGHADLALIVKDTGIGISQDQMNRIFTPFTQADASITRKYGGTGLGLPISKALLELMGGSLTVKSNTGIGTVFTINLRLGYTADSLENTLDEEKTNVTRFINTKVLLVEDNELNQQVASEIFTGFGIETDLASNGFDAVDKIVNGNLYDVIFMDLHMPLMDGYETARKIRLLNRDVPIISITADALEDTKSRVLESGMNDFILKPFEPQHVAFVIGKYVETKKIKCQPVMHLPVPKEHSDCLNTGDALQRLNGKTEIYQKALVLFKNKEIKTPQDIRQATASSNRDLSVRLAHSLKGSAGNIGAYEVAAYASEIQQRLENEPYEIEEVLNLLEAALNRVSQAIDSYLADKKVNEPPA